MTVTPLTPNASRVQLGIALLRLVLGVVFLAHGIQKLFVFGHGGVTAAFAQMGVPSPELMATLATAIELLCGIALIVGIVTRYAAVLLAIEMFLAIVFVKARGGFFLPNGAEYELTLCIALVALVLTGPGALALEHALTRRDARVSR
ncbi:MAG TPA: DoxX family protein [Gemmatimonadaceae bacterium]